MGGRQLAVDDRVDGPRRGCEFSLQPDLDLRGVERIEAHFDGLASQMRRSLVETVVQQEGGIAAHHAIEASFCLPHPGTWWTLKRLIVARPSYVFDQVANRRFIRQIERRSSRAVGSRLSLAAARTTFRPRHTP